MKNFAVTLHFVDYYTGWDEPRAIYRVHAQNKRDAIRQVRGMAGRDGIMHWAKQGRVVITARPNNEV